MILFTSFENKIFKGLQSKADLRENESRFSRLIARSLNSVSVCVQVLFPDDGVMLSTPPRLLLLLLRTLFFASLLPSYTDSSSLCHSNSAAAAAAAAAEASAASFPLCNSGP